MNIFQNDCAVLGANVIICREWFNFECNEILSYFCICEMSFWVHTMSDSPAVVEMALN